MCGIAGIVDFRARSVEPAELEHMARAMRHRGPDDMGVYRGEGVGLTNVRLAVIDMTSGGHQPMSSDDASHVLVYNGELYNYRELAAELKNLGHVFRSRSDTEVVLRAYEEWGQACVERFNGMFALAVWDTASRTLFLARDRFGVKPLYYALRNDRFLFGSEVKALLAAGLVARVSPEALIEYFTFQNILSNKTLFDSVHLLRPGTAMTVARDGTSERTYWDLVLEPEPSLGEADWIELLRDGFEHAVTRQLVSDVPIGSYLSGGMDSASIVAVASRSVPRLMTFTGGFDLSSVEGLELVFDERREAELIASNFRTEHYEMIMHAGDMAWVLPELVWHVEDLRLGMSYQNHYIARLASKFVKVVLAGGGGDELFGGYPWRYSIVENATDPSEFERLHYGYWARLLADVDRADFFSGEMRQVAAAYAPIDAYRDVIAPAAELDPISKALYFEAKTFLHGLLVVDDKISMAHSLEARVPFLDNELTEIARRIPPDLKHGHEGGKRILREAMRGLLPASIVEKPKQGFSPPDGSWYRGPTMDYIRSILLDPRAMERGYFEPRAVRAILEEHLRGRVNHRLLIWSLLSFEWWNRLFIDGESTARHSLWHQGASVLPSP